MNIDELFEKKYNSLPSVVKDVINDPNIVKILDSVSAQLNLDDVKKEMLTEEVLYVLFSEKPLSDFSKNLYWNLLLNEKQSEFVANSLDDSIFKPIRKFLKTTTASPKNITPPESNVENINHVDLLNEIENPSTSFNVVSPVTIMPKEAQKLMTQDETLPIQTTPAPQLQEIAEQVMPAIGGFLPVDDPLKPTKQVVGNMEEKLTSVTKTPVKEVYIPKKPDPYREPIA